MAGPFSPFRPSVPATNDPNRLGLPFRQPSGVRSFEDLHRPLSEYPTHYRAEITVEAEDVVSACRSACRCVAYDRRMEEPRYGASHVCPRLSLKVRTSILGALSSMAALPPPCPSRACSRKPRRARAIPRPGARIWSTACASGSTRSAQMERPRITPAAMVRLCATWQALLDDIATFGLSPTSTVAASVVTSAPYAT